MGEDPARQASGTVRGVWSVTLEKAEKTNATRVLDAREILYEAVSFPPHIHSAAGVAEAVGLSPQQVLKTLVVLQASGRPMLVMVGGDRQLDLKQVARAVGAKKVRLATRREAEALTGLQVGGISALALLSHPFDVFIDHRATQLCHVLVSAGKQGVNLRIGVPDLIRITGACSIEATAEEGDSEQASQARGCTQPPKDVAPHCGEV